MQDEQQAAQPDALQDALPAEWDAVPEQAVPWNAPDAQPERDVPSSAPDAREDAPQDALPGQSPDARP